MVADERLDAELGAGCPDQRDLGVVSVEKRLIATTGGTPKMLHVLDMAREVGHAGFERLQVLGLRSSFGDAAVHLQRPDGRDDHGARGRQAGLAALDVEELLAAEVGAEAGLGHDIVGELQRRRASPCTELQPWAMLANGPPWTKAGLPSSVCTRLGASASFSSAVIAPCALRSRARTAAVARVGRR